MNDIFFTANKIRLKILRFITNHSRSLLFEWTLDSLSLGGISQSTHALDPDEEFSWERVLQLGTKTFYGEGYGFHNPTANLWSARPLKLYHELIPLKVVGKFSLRRCESQPRKSLMKEKIRLIWLKCSSKFSSFSSTTGFVARYRASFSQLDEGLLLARYRASSRSSLWKLSWLNFDFL